MISPRTRRRPRGLSLRLKLTLSYAGFLLVSGAVFSGLVLLLIRYVPDESLWTRSGGFAPDRSDLLDALLPKFYLGLAFFAVVGLVGGWFLAGAMLKPIDSIRAVALSVGNGSWSDRIDLPGRRDELRDLADSFDDMLERMQRSYDEQRRFTANASHELRTPHTVIRTLLDVADADHRSVDLARLLSQLHKTNDRAIALVESLLVLSKAENDSLNREPCDLAELAAESLTLHQGDLTGRQVVVELDSAPFRGDPILMSQLIGNLIRNAATHNLPEGGWVRVTTGPAAPDGASTLTVENSGDVIPPALAATLAEPFVRATARTASDGFGLGLAIATSIARAHAGDLTLDPGQHGGLRARVQLSRS